MRSPPGPQWWRRLRSARTPSRDTGSGTSLRSGGRGCASPSYGLQGCGDGSASTEVVEEDPARIGEKRFLRGVDVGVEFRQQPALLLCGGAILVLHPVVATAGRGGRAADEDQVGGRVDQRAAAGAAGDAVLLGCELVCHVPPAA